MDLINSIKIETSLCLKTNNFCLTPINRHRDGNQEPGFEFLVNLIKTIRKENSLRWNNITDEALGHSEKDMSQIPSQLAHSI